MQFLEQIRIHQINPIYCLQNRILRWCLVHCGHIEDLIAIFMFGHFQFMIHTHQHYNWPDFYRAGWVLGECYWSSARQYLMLRWHVTRIIRKPNISRLLTFTTLNRLVPGASSWVGQKEMDIWLIFKHWSEQKWQQRLKRWNLSTK